MRYVAGRIFLKNGHRGIEAQNGKEGVEMAIKCAPNLITMDVMMPIMDGVDALRHIRSRGELESTPVVMLTAESDVPTIQEVMSLGVSDYILKENATEIESRLRNYSLVM